jgi:hypothetical protein
MSEENNNELMPLIHDEEFRDYIINEGKKIIESNEFFSDLEAVMNTAEFRTFYDKYFKDFNDIKTALMFMKLYESLEKEYEAKYSSQIPGPVIVYIMKEIMSDSGMRMEVINSYKEFIDEKNIAKRITLLNIFNQIKFLK